MLGGVRLSSAWGRRTPLRDEAGSLIEGLRQLAEEMMITTDMSHNGKEVLEHARAMSRRLRPYDLEPFESDVQFTCYFFTKVVNDLWRNFGGDSSAGFPLREAEPLAEAMVHLLNALGCFLKYSLYEQQSPQLILEQCSRVIAIYTSLLRDVEKQLVTKGGAA